MGVFPLNQIIEIGQKWIPTKLALKKKDEIDELVRFKSRNITLGFIIVLGSNFTERFSLVAIDKALNTQISINFKKHEQSWRACSCDIEAVFLETTIDNETFIELHAAIVACQFLTEFMKKIIPSPL